MSLGLFSSGKPWDCDRETVDSHISDSVCFGTITFGLPPFYYPCLVSFKKNKHQVTPEQKPANHISSYATDLLLLFESTTQCFPHFHRTELASDHECGYTRTHQHIGG